MGHAGGAISANIVASFVRGLTFANVVALNIVSNSDVQCIMYNNMNLASIPMYDMMQNNTQDFAWSKSYVL